MNRVYSIPLLSQTAKTSTPYPSYLLRNTYNVERKTHIKISFTIL